MHEQTETVIPNKRPKVADIQRVLAGGKRLTAREIAAELQTTPRQVQQVVSNAFWPKKRSVWLGRYKEDYHGAEYVYFLV